MKTLTSIAALTLTISLCAPVHAQSKLQGAEPPQGVVNNAQPWLSHQEWFCIPRGTFDANKFAKNMAFRLTPRGDDVERALTIATSSHLRGCVAHYEARETRADEERSGANLDGHEIRFRLIGEKLIGV